MPDDREAIIPERYEKFYSEWHYAPAHRLHNMLYVSGHGARRPLGTRRPERPSERPAQPDAMGV